MTVRIIEYMPLDGLHTRWHADQLIAVGEFHQRPVRILDLRPLSRGRFDELDKGSRWGTIRGKNSLVGAVSHHPSNRHGFISEDRWLPPPLLKDKDEEIDSKIPLRTGCDAAALSILVQTAAGAGWIVAPRMRSLNSVQNAASRVSVVNPTIKGGGNPYCG